MIFDVAIVGTGPAGGSAALKLASSGLKIIILEKTSLPRFKPCGGLMPSVVIEHLDKELFSLVKHRVTEVLNLNNFKDPQKQTINQDMILIDRASFDAGLIELSLERAEGRISLYEHFLVREVVETETHVQVISQDGQSVLARYLIGADGVSSKVARCIGLNPKPDVATTIDAEVTVTPECYERESQRVTFNFSCLPAGYGWIFPKQKPYLSCGVGSWTRADQIQQHMNLFLTRAFEPEQVIHIEKHGFPIPIWSGHIELATRRVCLAGDAASLVDPVSGEGIRFASFSGKVAAETIITALSSDKSLHPYTERIQSTLGRKFKFKRQFLFLAFTQAPDFFYKAVVKDGSSYSQP